MNVFIIGGSYFLGKTLIDLIKDEHQVTVLNRGSRPLNLPSVQEIVGDRHDKTVLSGITGHFDAIIDFCAYKQGDIADLFDHLGATFDQYLFVSTCDVYERGLGRFLDEQAPLEYRDFGGEAGSYISGKVALEKELKAKALEKNVKETSIRPAFVYGPNNYAPRESMYFYWLQKENAIIHPSDSTGEFQMVYAGDVAKCISKCIGNPTAHHKAYNLAPQPMVTYDSFAELLHVVTRKDFVKQTISVEEIINRGIPLPFPLTKEESNWYDGEKVLELIGSYTPLSDGLKSTYDFWCQE